MRESDEKVKDDLDRHGRGGSRSCAVAGYCMVLEKLQKEGRKKEIRRLKVRRYS